VGLIPLGVGCPFLARVMTCLVASCQPIEELPTGQVTRSAFRKTGASIAWMDCLRYYDVLAVALEQLLKLLVRNPAPSTDIHQKGRSERMISWFLDSIVLSRSKLALLRSVMEPEAIPPLAS
jgi:hypothetical protein